MLSRSAHTILFMITLCLTAITGCSLERNRFRTQNTPVPLDRLTKTTDDQAIVDEVRADHQERAELIQSVLVRELRVDARDPEQSAVRQSLSGAFSSGLTQGTLAMQRPDNLLINLKLIGAGQAIAELGSNAEEFWLTVNSERLTYLGDRATTSQSPSPLVASIQPAWFFEILGLNPINPNATIADDDDPDSILLVERRQNPGELAFVKETVISVPRARVVEHRLYTAEPRELVARASVSSRHRVVKISDDETATETTVLFPEQVSVLIPGVKKLDLTFRNIQANFDGFDQETFARAERSDLRVERITDFIPEERILASNEIESSRTAVSDSNSVTLESGLLDPSVSQVDSLPREDLSVEIENEFDQEVQSQGFSRSSTLFDGTSYRQELPQPPQSGSEQVTRRDTWQRSTQNRFRRASLGIDR